MANKKFLEEYSLYKKFEANFSQHTKLKDIPKSPINMYCDYCESDQTFNMNNDYNAAEDFRYPHYPHSLILSDICPLVVRALYICSACNKSHRYFLIRFYTKTVVKKEGGKDVERTVVHMEKVGQYPPWSIEMDRELEKLLGKHSVFYKCGLVCESHGYGIGAFAYYRRIIEEIIDQLLESVEEVFTNAEEKTKYKTALEEVKGTQVTQEKIEIVKDLLPDTLRPDGRNPLSALHSALSEGLHAEDEATCLDYAEAVRGSLVFLVNRLERTKSENRDYSASIQNIQKLLDKKNGKKIK